MVTGFPRTAARVPGPDDLGPDPEIPGARFAPLLAQATRPAPVRRLPSQPRRPDDPRRPAAAAA